MNIHFKCKTQEQKKLLEIIIKEEAENHFDHNYEFRISTYNEIVVHIDDLAYYTDIEYANQTYRQIIYNNGRDLYNIRTKPHYFINDVEDHLNFDIKITLHYNC